MSSFQQRAPRLDLSFPLQLQIENVVVEGHCLNLSESGLLGLFDEPLELWTSGEVYLQAGSVDCRLQARVARVAEREAGLAFSFRNDAERRRVRDILAVAADKTHLVGPPPF